jgi:hypothetical protein
MFDISWREMKKKRKKSGFLTKEIEGSQCRASKGEGVICVYKSFD